MNEFACQTPYVDIFGIFCFCHKLMSAFILLSPSYLSSQYTAKLVCIQNSFLLSTKLTSLAVRKEAQEFNSLE